MVWAIAWPGVPCAYGRGSSSWPLPKPVPGVIAGRQERWHSSPASTETVTSLLRTQSTAPDPMRAELNLNPNGAAGAELADLFPADDHPPASEPVARPPTRPRQDDQATSSMFGDGQLGSQATVGSGRPRGRAHDVMPVDWRVDVRLIGAFAWLIRRH